MSNNRSEIEQILTARFNFRYNEITNKVEYRRRSVTNFTELTDYQLNSILRDVNSNLRKCITKKELTDLLNSNFTKIYNPFREYFENLEPWVEGMPDYIQELANTVIVPENEQENWNQWFKKWMIATIACAIDDTQINQQVLIFAGAQGIGKTTWMHKLCPNSLKKYYYGGNINPGNKDTEIQLTENILINLDELENLNRKDINSLKEIITKPSIKIRRPYGTVAETLPRRASFMGSVNNMEFLRDNTGTRRFLCFNALSINHNHTVDLDLVFAQALYLYGENCKFWFDGSEIQEINAHNEKYTVIPLEQEILEKYYRPALANEIPDKELETSDLLNDLYTKSDISKRLSPKGLGSTLTKLNWPKRKTGGRRKWLICDR